MKKTHYILVILPTPFATKVLLTKHSESTRCMLPTLEIEDGLHSCEAALQFVESIALLHIEKFWLMRSPSYEIQVCLCDAEPHALPSPYCFESLEKASDLLDAPILESINQAVATTLP